MAVQKVLGLLLLLAGAVALAAGVFDSPRSHSAELGPLDGAAFVRPRDSGTLGIGLAALAVGGLLLIMRPKE